jgi:hypothetical protein
MTVPIWKHSSFWWVPIVVILLSGAGWVVKEYFIMSASAATIFGKIKNCPGEVSILIDGNELTKTSKFGHYRLDEIMPGTHEIQWTIKGYETKYSVIDVQGGIQNRVDLTELSIINNDQPEIKIEDTLSVRTEIHNWYAGTRYDGIVDMEYKFGFSWDCSGGTCTLSGPYGTGLNMEVCQELSKKVGGLEYYYNDAGMKWTKTENTSLLDQCNAAPNTATESEVNTLHEVNDNANQMNLILNEFAKPISNCLKRNDTNHPSFHGCIDWHSAVHGTWALIRYRMVTGDYKYDQLINSILDTNHMESEFSNIKKIPSFEMPYGRAWFLRLVIDYEREFKSNALKEFGDYIATSIVEYYSNTPIDPYAKSYSNSSWALINLYQYGSHRDNEIWKDYVINIVNEKYIDPSNKCHNINTNEPQGFMDVCGNWEYLVAETDATENYKTWLDLYVSESGIPTPITKPKDTHEKGLNFSRAWSSWYVYNKTNDHNYLNSYIDHMETQLNNIDWWKGDDYLVTHWVAQFGVYALTPMYN